VTITITVSGAVPQLDNAVKLARALTPLLPLLLPVLEEVVPGLGIALALARVGQTSISTHLT
jgi:lysylphosphatidylglycerol synthetase-like protein (DUF2156 family)